VIELVPENHRSAEAALVNKGPQSWDSSSQRDSLPGNQERKDASDGGEV